MLHTTVIAKLDFTCEGEQYYIAQSESDNTEYHIEVSKQDSDIYTLTVYDGINSMGKQLVEGTRKELIQYANNIHRLGMIYDKYEVE